MRQPPEKLSTGSRLLRLGEAKAREQRRRARARAVAADRLEAMMQLGERAPPSCAARHRASARSMSRSSASPSST